MPRKKINARTILFYIALAGFTALLFAILDLQLALAIGSLFGLLVSAAATSAIAGLIARYLYSRRGEKRIVEHELRGYTETAKRIWRTQNLAIDEDIPPKEEPMLKELGLLWLPEALRERISEKAEKIKDPQLKMEIIKREVMRDLWNLETLKRELENSGAKRVETHKRFERDMFSHEIDLMVKTDDRTLPIMVKYRSIMPSDVESVICAYNDIGKTIKDLSRPYIFTTEKISSIVQRDARKKRVTLIMLKCAGDVLRAVE